MPRSSFDAVLEYSVDAIKVYKNNMSTIAFVKKGKFTSHRTKHIEVRHSFIEEKIDEGEIEVEYAPTLQIPADIAPVMRSL